MAESEIQSPEKKGHTAAELEILLAKARAEEQSPSILNGVEKQLGLSGGSSEVMNSAEVSGAKAVAPSAEAMDTSKIEGDGHPQVAEAELSSEERKAFLTKMITDDLTSQDWQKLNKDVTGV